MNPFTIFETAESLTYNALCYLNGGDPEKRMQDDDFQAANDEEIGVMNTTSDLIDQDRPYRHLWFTVEAVKGGFSFARETFWWGLGYQTTQKNSEQMDDYSYQNQRHRDDFITDSAETKRILSNLMGSSSAETQPDNNQRALL